jgi:hypothetical protein
MLGFGQDVPLSPSEQRISLLILGILLAVAFLGVFLGPYLWAAWKDLVEEVKKTK